MQAVDPEAKGRPWEWRQQHPNQWRKLNNDQNMPSIRLKASTGLPKWGYEAAEAASLSRLIDDGMM